MRPFLFRGVMEIKIVKIDDLIFAEYNPRSLSKDQYKNLKNSITRFGLVDPIIVNSNEKRKNIVIGGHQRLKIAKEMGIVDIPTVEVNLTLEKERELNIRLNQNTGAWDWDSLANNFDIDDLMNWGFDEIELQCFNDEEEEKEEKQQASAKMITCPECGHEFTGKKVRNDK